ncbi:hypothetical protein ACH5RR_009634 [Cinchona calisaya]|uniref:Uncharacterized protein n=1 Tax=Cinchona calisaya TaxID=153742 RepID=A0ABD3AHV0_9GENT
MSSDHFTADWNFIISIDNTANKCGWSYDFTAYMRQREISEHGNSNLMVGSSFLSKTIVPKFSQIETNYVTNFTARFENVTVPINFKWVPNNSSWGNSESSDLTLELYFKGENEPLLKRSSSLLRRWDYILPVYIGCEKVFKVRISPDSSTGAKHVYIGWTSGPCWC